ncbi:MAG: DUF423 domain-containing protein [Flavobacterium sp.]|nr:DUF423 domain-containing protein [Flavobacterium sp.]
MDRRIIWMASLFGMTAVIFGAFGAHLLKNKLGTSELVTFETGVRYQMFHALLLLFVGICEISSKLRRTIFILITLGIVLFSGSIYLLATNQLTNFDFKVIGFVTPIGGLFLIVGWAILMFHFIGKKSIKSS